MKPDINYNPDVLSCLANLSNDEVFTPPAIVNSMLDMLPQGLFMSPDSRFLDPCCKSGVFLREIAKRLIKGLEPVIPDIQHRIDHIFHHQLFGISITQLTALLSRRSLYCSRNPSSPYSVTAFDSEEGKIRYHSMQHTWESGKCIFCGAAESQYGDIRLDDGLETHAYEFIHTNNPKSIFDMEFDVIIGNPPYQLNTSETSKQAKPIYHFFVEQAKKLNPRFLAMIIPSRWFAGGMGLDNFRESMMHDPHITRIVDYANAKDCFPMNSISGGVCYFLRERERTAPCQFTNVNAGEEHTSERPLDEFEVLVRYNQAVDILHKVLALQDGSLSDIASPLMPYALPSNYRGRQRRRNLDDLVLHASNGITYIGRDEVTKGVDSIDCYKVMLSILGAEHAGEPSKDGNFRVITSSMKVINPGEVCTHSYFIIGPSADKNYAENVYQYLRTNFVRFLMLLAMSSIHISKLVFKFVPMQDFSETWDDDKLNAKYGLTPEEIAFINSMIRPID